jgi:GT2 family glycosyltransferase
MSDTLPPTQTDLTSQLGQGPFIPYVCEGPGVPGLVSVLIPTYNRAYILGKAIDSVLAQTYRQIEVIVVDDGSTDDTRAMLARYGDRVRCIHQENAGLAAARNSGLAVARGEFIAFQDSDDEWEPWKLEAQVTLMQRLPKLVLTWTDMSAISPDGELIRERHLSTMYHAYRSIDTNEFMPHTASLNELWPTSPAALANTTCRWGDIFSAMFMGNIVHPPTALMRRSAVHRAGGLDLAYAWSCEDYEFFWRVSRQGDSGLIDAPGMRYRVDASDQLTKPGLRLYVARGNLAALEDRLQSAHREAAPFAPLSPALLRAHLAEAYGWLGEEELFSPAGRRGIAIKSLWTALRMGVRETRLLKLLIYSLTLPSPLVQWLRAVKTSQTPQSA